MSFPWGLFAVLVGTLLPFSVFMRSLIQLLHDLRLGFTHTLNIYRMVTAALVLPVLVIIAPAGIDLLFGLGDPALTARVVRFLGTWRGYVTTGSMLIGVLMLDAFRPRMTEQLSRLPISRQKRTPLEVREDAAILLICAGLAVATSLVMA